MNEENDKVTQEKHNLNDASTDDKHEDMDNKSGLHEENNDVKLETEEKEPTPDQISREEFAALTERQQDAMNDNDDSQEKRKGGIADKEEISGHLNATEDSEGNTSNYTVDDTTSDAKDHSQKSDSSVNVIGDQNEDMKEESSHSSGQIDNKEDKPQTNYDVSVDNDEQEKKDGEGAYGDANGTGDSPSGGNVENDHINRLAEHQDGIESESVELDDKQHETDDETRDTKTPTETPNDEDTFRVSKESENLSPETTELNVDEPLVEGNLLEKENEGYTSTETNGNGSGKQDDSSKEEGDNSADIDEEKTELEKGDGRGTNINPDEGPQESTQHSCDEEVQKLPGGALDSSTAADFNKHDMAQENVETAGDETENNEENSGASEVEVESNSQVENSPE